MWLDRLTSGQGNGAASSNSQPASRPYSPLPRRTSSSLSPYVTSQRHGHSPRGSSLSLVSNDSSVSLLPSSRKPNGSGLRQTSTFEQGPDPLQVLENLLKTGSSDKKVPDRTRSVITEEDLRLGVDFGGLTLKELAASDTTNATPASLQKTQTVEECKALRNAGGA